MLSQIKPQAPCTIPSVSARAGLYLRPGVCEQLKDPLAVPRVLPQTHAIVVSEPSPRTNQRGLAADCHILLRCYHTRGHYPGHHAPFDAQRGSRSFASSPQFRRVAAIPAGLRLAFNDGSHRPFRVAVRRRVCVYAWWCPSVNFFKFQPCDHTPPRTQTL